MSLGDHWRWETCCHEAGHACAALLLGFSDVGAVVFDNATGIATPEPLAAIALPPDEYYDAICSRYKGRPWADLLREATFIAAGCAAVDLLLHPEKRQTFVRDKDEDMLREIARAAIAPPCGGYCQMAFRDVAAARARSLLEPFLPRVEKVARALDKRGRLTADDVVRAGWPEHGEQESKQKQEFVNAIV